MGLLRTGLFHRLAVLHPNWAAGLPTLGARTLAALAPGCVVVTQGEGLLGGGSSILSLREGTVGRRSSVFSEGAPFTSRENGEGTHSLSPCRIPKPAVFIVVVYISVFLPELGFVNIFGQGTFGLSTIFQRTLDDILMFLSL